MTDSTSKRIKTWLIDRMTLEKTVPQLISLVIVSLFSVGGVVTFVRALEADQAQRLRCAGLAEQVRVAPDLLALEKARTLLKVEGCIF